MSTAELFVRLNKGWCCRELGPADGEEGKTDVILARGLGGGGSNLY